MEQNSLFQNDVQKDPLAARLRPASLQDYVGQKHLLGKGKILYNLIEKDMVSSMIFWGPPGVGKTTLARIIARQTQAHFINFSAVTSGIREIKAVMKEAEDARLYGRKTIVFVDEIHRFNKAQQDAFLPYVEKGSIILIGATTENPSFEVNAALLSRCKVFVLKALEVSDLVELLKHALQDERGFGSQHVLITEEQLHMLAVFANGDARTALNTLEMVVLNGESSEAGIVITKEVLEQCTSQKSLLYERQGEEHYNLISALHKSMRTVIRTRPFTGCAGCWRWGKSALYRPQADPLCQRRHRNGGQWSASDSGGSLSGMSFPGDAGVRCPSGTCSHLSCYGAKIKCVVPCV